MRLRHPCPLPLSTWQSGDYNRQSRWNQTQSIGLLGTLVLPRLVANLPRFLGIEYARFYINYINRFYFYFEASYNLIKSLVLDFYLFINLFVYILLI